MAKSLDDIKKGVREAYIQGRITNLFGNEYLFDAKKTFGTNSYDKIGENNKERQEKLNKAINSEDIVSKLANLLAIVKLEDVNDAINEDIVKKIILGNFNDTLLDALLRKDNKTINDLIIKNIDDIKDDKKKQELYIKALGYACSNFCDIEFIKSLCDKIIDKSKLNSDIIEKCYDSIILLYINNQEDKEDLILDHIKSLLENKIIGSYSEDILIYALNKKNTELAKLLLNKEYFGVLSDKSIKKIIALNNHGIIDHVIKAYGNQDSLFSEACKGSNLDLVKYLVDIKGVDVNQKIDINNIKTYINNPLIDNLRSPFGSKEIAKYLMQKGADASGALIYFVSLQDSNQYTDQGRPVYISQMNTKKASINYLLLKATNLDLGLNITFKDSKTALSIAVNKLKESIEKLSKIDNEKEFNNYHKDYYTEHLNIILDLLPKYLEKKGSIKESYYSDLMRMLATEFPLFKNEEKISELQAEALQYLLASAKKYFATNIGTGLINLLPQLIGSAPTYLKNTLIDHYNGQDVSFIPNLLIANIQEDDFKSAIRIINRKDLETTVDEEVKKALSDALSYALDCAIEKLVEYGINKDTEKKKSELIKIINYLKSAGIQLSEIGKKRSVDLLHKAIKESNLDAVQILIAQGANFAELDKDGKNALDYAIEKLGNSTEEAKAEEIIELLCKKDAQLSEKSKKSCVPALHKVIRSNNVKATQYLINLGVDLNAQHDECTALDIAVCNDVYILQILLNKEKKEGLQLKITPDNSKVIEKFKNAVISKVNKDNTLENKAIWINIFLSHGLTPEASFSLDKNTTSTILEAAMKSPNCDLETLDLLLQKAKLIPMCFDDKTPMKREHEVIKYILDNYSKYGCLQIEGAMDKFLKQLFNRIIANNKDEVVDFAQTIMGDPYNKIPNYHKIMIESIINATEIKSQLLDVFISKIKAAGKFDHVDDNKRTMLINASIRNNSELCQILINKGADVNAQDKDGKTAWMHAIEKGNDYNHHTSKLEKQNNESMLDKIINNSQIKLDLKDKDGKTTVDYLRDRLGKEAGRSSGISGLKSYKIMQAILPKIDFKDDDERIKFYESLRFQSEPVGKWHRWPDTANLLLDKDLLMKINDEAKRKKFVEKLLMYAISDNKKEALENLISFNILDKEKDKSKFENLKREAESGSKTDIVAILNNIINPAPPIKPSIPPVVPPVVPATTTSVTTTEPPIVVTPVVPNTKPAVPTNPVVVTPVVPDSTTTTSTTTTPVIITPPVVPNAATITTTTTTIRTTTTTTVIVLPVVPNTSAVTPPAIPVVPKKPTIPATTTTTITNPTPIVQTPVSSSSTPSRDLDKLRDSITDLSNLIANPLEKQLALGVKKNIEIAQYIKSEHNLTNEEKKCFDEVIKNLKTANVPNWSDKVRDKRVNKAYISGVVGLICSTIYLFVQGKNPEIFEKLSKAIPGTSMLFKATKEVAKICARNPLLMFVATCAITAIFGVLIHRTNNSISKKTKDNIASIGTTLNSNVISAIKNKTGLAL